MRAPLFEFLFCRTPPHQSVSQDAVAFLSLPRGRVTNPGLGEMAPRHWTRSYAVGDCLQGALSHCRPDMQLESLAAAASRLKLKEWPHDQMSAEAEIGSERDRGLNALQVVSSSRECDSRSSQRHDSWCRVFRQHVHRSGPYDGDSVRTPRNLGHFESLVSHLTIYAVLQNQFPGRKVF